MNYLCFLSCTLSFVAQLSGGLSSPQAFFDGFVISTLFHSVMTNTRILNTLEDYAKLCKMLCFYYQHGNWRSNFLI